MATDTNKCLACKKPIVYKLQTRATGKLSDPVAEHKRDTADEDRFLNSRWLSATSIRDRRKELAARCPYEAKEK